jgi:hypothetical protein
MHDGPQIRYGFPELSNCLRRQKIFLVVKQLGGLVAKLCCHSESPE